MPHEQLIRTIVITGATGAIGGALARTYAARLMQDGVETKLVLQGRQVQMLDQIAASCRESGAHVETVALDLTDRAALSTWIETLQAMPVDLFIANAGININPGVDQVGERWEDMDALIELNIRATMLLVNRMLASMRARKAGQIAIVSSLAAYYGLPMAASYCASKAALKAYGEGLRILAACDGVKVNVVMPGYVLSDMNTNMPGPKPFMLTAEDAAQRIMRGLSRNRARISFPFPLNFGTWWLAVLPARVSARILQWMGYGV